MNHRQLLLNRLLYLKWITHNQTLVEQLNRLLYQKSMTQVKQDLADGLLLRPLHANQTSLSDHEEGFALRALEALLVFHAMTLAIGWLSHTESKSCVALRPLLCSETVRWSNTSSWGMELIARSLIWGHRYDSLWDLKSFRILTGLD